VARPARERDRAVSLGQVPFSVPIRNSQRRVARVQVVVRDNNIDQALKALKKKLQREGVFREMKLRRHYEKPSERRAREAAEAVRRARKVERKRLEREGF
jgi:small subunit ribosomal protein S21